MSLYKNWVRLAYDAQGNTISKTWDIYLPLEQKIYEEMLSTKTPAVEGVISELAQKYNMSQEFFIGFLDGISSALDEPPELDELESDSHIKIQTDFETLYKKMVEFKAYHLIDLPEWDNVFDKETRDAYYKEQKNSRTVVREVKLGRNEPCHCGSGKKYKKCCYDAS